jgi:hypothetical protein
MTIEIRDASLEARIQKHLQATGSSSVEEVLPRLLDTQEKQDRWLLENRDETNAKIRRGMAQLDRGEGIPDDRFRAKVQEALDDPRPAIPHKKVEEHFAERKRRAATARTAR